MAQKALRRNGATGDTLMGYFSSLARQAGIVPGKRGDAPARPARGLEVDVIRVAGPALPPAPSQASAGVSTSVPPMDIAAPVEAPQPVKVESSAIPAAAPREVGSEFHPPARIETRERAAEVEIAAPVPDDAAVLSVPEKQPERLPAPELPAPSPAIRVGQEERPQPAGERRMPTYADVRAWVAEPLLEAPEALASQAEAPRPKAERRAPEPLQPPPERQPDYKLEIGTIQIVVEEPAAAVAPQPPRPAPPVPAGNHPSRYYIRF
jgi:hypothetical protein